MDDNKQLAQRIDGAIQSASQEVTNLRSELSATSRRLAELGASDSPSLQESLQHNHNGETRRTLLPTRVSTRACAGASRGSRRSFAYLEVNVGGQGALFWLLSPGS